MFDQRAQGIECLAGQWDSLAAAHQAMLARFQPEGPELIDRVGSLGSHVSEK
jgi:hypothetical protein